VQLAHKRRDGDVQEKRVDNDDEASERGDGERSPDEFPFNHYTARLATTTGCKVRGALSVTAIREPLRQRSMSGNNTTTKIL